MQMGRWFGYRNGYADLCRIWMKEVAPLVDKLTYNFLAEC